jgi:glutaredoxin 3
MADVTIYTTPFCPYCMRAKKLLQKKGVAYKEIDVSNSSSSREEMMQRAGGRSTVPQIFIDGAHIGGSDELYALESKSQLDPLLQNPAQ